MPINDRIFFDMPNPTPADLEDPLFNAIWEVTKDWDLNAPKHYDGYCEMNGSHVMIILNAVRDSQKPKNPPHPGAHYRRMDPQPTQGRVSWRPGYQTLISQASTYRIDGKLYTAPIDMPTAMPWQCKDGEWYWRRNVG